MCTIRCVPGSPLSGRAALDAEVWAALEEADSALTVAQVQRSLGRWVVYSTVLTSLKRLQARGDVVRSLAGRVHRYAPVDDTAGVVAREMRRALDTTGCHVRREALARFVRSLDDGDRDELVRITASPI